MAAIGFNAPTHHILITIHLFWQDYMNTLLMPVTLSSAEHGRWKEPIHNRSVGDSSKDVSPRPCFWADSVCINVEVFIYGVKINAGLKSITSWEPVR